MSDGPPNPAQRAAHDRQAEKELVRERTSLRELVEEITGEMRSRGADDLWACCPFHREDSPSFHIRPSRGLYKCFGCGEAGDVFSFVERTRNIPFREALEWLAERCGVELGSVSPEEKRRQAEQRAARAALEAARALFAAGLKSPTGAPARRYLAERGFSDATLERFDVGFIPADFLRTLRSRAGVGPALDTAGFTAAFGGRVSFGIRDAQGGLVGFGARRLGGDEFGPKYVNTRETPWFAKARLLYGFDKAALRVARQRRLVVMEGYTDVMMAHQRGIDDAVATMGTSFTAEHLRIVKARVGNLILLFDGDEAGQRAAERAARMVLGEGMECRVLLLADGADPCDWLAGHDAAAFDALVERQAVSAVAFLGRRLLSGGDAGQPGRREEVARELLELTARLEDAIRRETVLADIARACGVDRNLLRRQAGAPPAPRPRPPAVGGRVNARVRCQFVAVAGLASSVERLDALRELRAQQALDHETALQLLELAESLLQTEGGFDADGWLRAAARRSEGLHAALERALLPPPGVLLPDWDEAVAHLRRQREDELAREERRRAIARPDLASNDQILKSVQSSLTAGAARGARSA